MGVASVGEETEGFINIKGGAFGGRGQSGNWPTKVKSSRWAGMLSGCGCCGAGQELGARQGWAGEGCGECEFSAMGHSVQGQTSSPSESWRAGV